MKRVLLTGSSGFIGRNVSSVLSQCCELFMPSRTELNLFNEQAVREYLVRNKIDIVIHCANPNPVKNSLDHADNMFEESLRMFMNLFQAQDYYEMMYTLGSGAEYDKSKDICSVSEEEEFRSVPYDSYGFAKYIINQMIAKSEKQCNLRLFGCYGSTDHESKFITHAIRCCMRDERITIRQNCWFDYLHVSDLARIMAFFIEHKPSFRSYNVCSGEKVSLYKIAEIVRKQMVSIHDIVVLKDGWNKEYTASNQRLLSELGGYQFLPLEEGIRLQIKSEREMILNEKKSL